MAKKNSSAPSQPSYGSTVTGGPSYVNNGGRSKNTPPPTAYYGGKNARPPAQTQMGYDVGAPEQPIFQPTTASTLASAVSPTQSNTGFDAVGSELERQAASARAQATPIGMVGSQPAGGWGANRNAGGEWQGELGPETGHRVLPDGSIELDNSGYWQSLGYAPGQSAFTTGDYQPYGGARNPWQSRVNALRRRG